MKKMMKKAAVLVLAGIMTAGMLTGCGEDALDGTKVVATVNGEDIEMGVLSFYARYQQAQTEAMYISFAGSLDNMALWSSQADSGKEYGEQAVLDTLEQLELMHIMRAKAADYGVELTDENKAAIEEAAAAFVAANSEETMADLAVSEGQIGTFLELYTYLEKMHDPIVADVDTEVSEEESRQSGFSYICVSVGEEDDADAKKADAETILAAVQEDPEAVMDDVLTELEMEDYMAFDGTFTTVAQEGEEESASYPMEVLTALRELEEGEVYPEIVEADNGYYILRLDTAYDEDATQSKIDSIITNRENDLYTEITEGWLAEAEITVNEDVLETLKLTDYHHFTLSYPETEEEVTDEEVVVVEDEATEEVAEEEVTDEEAADAVE